MEPFAAVSLAGAIVQFLQFSLDLFSRSKQLYQSSQGSLPEAVDAKVIANDFIRCINKLKVCGFRAGQHVDEDLKLLCDSSIMVAEELLSVLEVVRVKRGHQKWSTFKAAILSVHTQSQVHNLQKRLQALLQEVHLCIILALRHESAQHSNMIEALESKIDIQRQNFLEDLRILTSQLSTHPKQLGYGWIPEDHIKIDDGLGPIFMLPLDLCSTREDFLKILSFKHASRNLPGLPQIQQGHFEVFDWSESTEIHPDNWSSLVQGGRGIRLSYIMGTWHGFSRHKCIRCFKPRAQNYYGQRYKICSSCGLGTRRIDPDALPFEPEDVTIGYSPDQYREHRLKSRSQKQTLGNAHSTSGPQPMSANNEEYDAPPIDLVCRRLTIKWEPIFNIVHRYLHCRCVIRLSTPSRLSEEITILVFGICPRHNIQGVSHPDYGNIDYRKDPYFDQFGGYDSFRAVIFLSVPRIYELLGGERFLPEDQFEESFRYFDEASHRTEENGHFLERAFSRYAFEVNDKMEEMGAVLPDSVAEAVRNERLRQQSTSKFNFSSLSETQGLDLSNSPMMRQLHDILDGKWSGKPHWVIED